MAIPKRNKNVRKVTLVDRGLRFFSRENRESPAVFLKFMQIAPTPGWGGVPIESSFSNLLKGINIPCQKEDESWQFCEFVTGFWDGEKTWPELKWLVTYFNVSGMKLNRHGLKDISRLMQGKGVAQHFSFGWAFNITCLGVFKNDVFSVFSKLFSFSDVF